MEWLAPVFVAVIGGPTMWMLHRFDRRNSEQHAENGGILGGIRDAVVENRDDLREVKADVRSLKSEHRFMKVELGKIDSKLDEHVRGKSDV
jgi:hypothetical protein